MLETGDRVTCAELGFMGTVAKCVCAPVLDGVVCVRRDDGARGCLCGVWRATLDELQYVHPRPNPASPSVEALARALFDTRLTDEAACIAEKPEAIPHVLNVMWHVDLCAVVGCGRPKDAHAPPDPHEWIMSKGARPAEHAAAEAFAAKLLPALVARMRGAP